MRAARSSQTGTQSSLIMGMRMGLGLNMRQGHRWLVWLLLLLLAIPPQMVDGRYLPTRSHGDDLDKLRELMLQILELSNEDPQQQQQQQQQQPQQHPLLRLHNEANSGSSGTNTNNNPRSSNSNSNSNAAWLQKLSAMGALDELGGDAPRMGPNYGRY
ncbi:topoisomerase I damage affected protein 11 [Drosophila subobscura]|uniref:topoisomerase I damage affected protein 11 n=1 Tax=Drosophila subobscura TaxID=7241 RepID=UPI00155A720E|nr:topoisomerase I damage affected protein 11 [Drosophila subobscura]